MAARYPDGRYSSHMAYAVTWTPGTLVLSGDIDEFTVTHYHAMPTIEQTLDWLDGIHFDYLMGKSSAKKEYDADETLRTIIHFANEDAVPSLRALRDDMRAWRADTVEALCEWDSDETQWAVTGRAPSWRPAPSDRPVLADYLPERPAALQVTPLAGPFRNRSAHSVPDGWNLWHRLRSQLMPYFGVNDIFLASKRAEIKRELAHLLNGGPNDGGRIVPHAGPRRLLWLLHLFAALPPLACRHSGLGCQGQTDLRHTSAGASNMSAPPPGMEWVSVMHEGRRQRVARFTCGECGKVIDVTCNRHGAGPVGPTHKIRHLGWIADPDRHARETRCPDCAKPKPHKKEKPVKVETEIKISTPQRVQIRNLLDKHFDDAVGMYLDDMNDEKIAQTVKIPRAVVERMRETAYGPIRITAEVVALRAQVAKLQSDLDAMRTTAADLATRISKVST
jgi:transposase-like protein